MTKAVIDRFEENFAVLLVGDEQAPITVDRTVLPENIKEGTWLQITLENGTVTYAEIDHLKTDQMKETIAEKMARLRRGDHLR
jgi:hypothetical protein